MNTNELKKIIDEHKLWLENKGGQRANLTDADLSGANLAGSNLSGANLVGAHLLGSNLAGSNLAYADLAGSNLLCADLTGANLSHADLTRANLTDADLSGADLTRANLTDADLSGANGVNYAQCAFRGHGERGRQLLAVGINDSTMFFCGCFKGDEDRLRAYIKNDDPQLVESRLFALEFCINALAFSKP